MTPLDVVNDCLGSMGQRRINSLETPHPYKDAALSYLSRATSTIASDGWWFNREAITVTPDSESGQCVLPHDAYEFRAGRDWPGISLRGRILFDGVNGTDQFTAPVEGVLIRELPFEQLPPAAAAYIALTAVTRFQTDYDGDSTKTRQLKDEREEARLRLNAEETRQAKANLLELNPRLAYIRGQSPRRF